MGDVNVVAFTANSLEAVANVSVEDGAWLFYADAFHPGWIATVNGKLQPIAEANSIGLLVTVFFLLFQTEAKEKYLMKNSEENIN